MDFRLMMDSAEQLWQVWKPMIKHETSRFTFEQIKLPELLNVRQSVANSSTIKSCLDMSSARANINGSPVQRL